MEPRFWSKVNKNGALLVPALGDCWEWTARTMTGKRQLPYGKFKVGRRDVCAHIYSWELHYPDKPRKGLLVCHHCDNPPCVRPSHLFLGTHLDNNRDAMHKDRRPYGSQVNTARLDENTVRLIRELYEAGGRTQKSLGQQFGIAQANVSKIVLRKNWRRVS